jgi:DNA-binding transcriptional regulator YdaS (Cro superfamily)
LTNITKFEAFKMVIDRYGSQQKAADAVGVHQTTILKALQSTKEAKAEWVLQFEKDTDVSRHDLRPDIYPRPLNHLNQVSDMDCGEYGNRTPVLDKYLERA